MPEQVAVLRDEFNEAERNLRSDEEYSEIFAEDKATIEDFRKAAGFGPYSGDDGDSIQSADATSVSAGSHASSRRQPRLSLMSGISSIRSKTSTKGSLSPLYEGGSGEDVELTLSVTERHGDEP